MLSLSSYMGHKYVLVDNLLPGTTSYSKSLSLTLLTNDCALFL